jgi:dehydration protein DpgD
VHNALDLATLEALDEAWQRVENDEAIRVAILTGAGDRAFCAGADLRNFAPPGTEIEPSYPAFFPTLTKPVVAAVNGLALGGGTELLGVTDLRVAATHATFSLTEARIGLYPAGGGVVRFARQLPWPLAMELLVTGRRVSADEALRWGMVNRVVEPGDLMDAAEEYASLVLRCAPISVRAIKACALDTMELPLEEAFAASLSYQERATSSPDAAEGIRAFAEKRDPAWVTA